MHFHTYKMEDIINRGGGILVMQLYCANEKDELDLEKPVEIVSDGVEADAACRRYSGTEEGPERDLYPAALP